ASEDSGDGLRQGEQFFFRHESLKELCLLWNSTETATHVHFKPTFFFSVLDAGCGNATHVMHVGQSTRLFFATRESNLQLSSESMGVRMAKHEFRGSFGVWCYIENLASADAGERACSDVANRITARFARRNSDCSKPPHEIRRIVDVDVVQLEILACCHMQ